MATHTTVRRFERENSLAGRTETEIGRLEYPSTGGLVLRIYSEAQHLELSLTCAREAEAPMEKNSWTFTGPDLKPYKWQIFIQYPVLILNDNSQLPLARYKRAKLGIVSTRSRRPSLEILPAGVNSIDMIVVTFVSFMIYCFADSNPSYSS
ncbi:hypothetical protein BDP27DRAFT_1379797 [Rhodocollybia butyracea]|uniref:DUF6593 domain-containing protein n=1 Tax=Rhodocollybia butyracea TaxID=206335 RepID=A0A9P5Q2G1_9AGAR|nr:hypothetical protein BDP27DRAFT_1379797 [Rhodocollybia butyracea]